MINLLGDVWSQGAPDWACLLKDPRIKLHLYDKGEARPGRKMGHFTLLHSDVKSAESDAQALFLQLNSQKESLSNTQ